jgi:hypothetical protein
MRKDEHRWVVDSIEETVASIEVDGKDMITLPLWLLPGGAKQGDVLSVSIDRPAKGQRSVLTVAVDDVATKQALADSAAQVKKHGSPVKDPGGDITL